jgi:hypothetical protein
MGDEPELGVAWWWWKMVMMMVRFRRLWTPRCEGERSALVRRCWVQGQMLQLQLQPRWYRYVPMALEETPSFQMRVRRKPNQESS